MKKFNAERELIKLKFRRNKSKYLKYSLITISLGVVIVGGLFFSKSKYANNGTMTPVSTKVAPFVARDYILASYIDGEESSTIPTKDAGYVIDHVDCDNDATGTWDSNNWTLIIGNATKRTKCTAYFKTSPTLSNAILTAAGGTSAIEAKGTPDFSTTATTDEGMYMAEDDYGKSYYYRGAVTNNNVLFAGFCWKIIRVNGNGTVRIIYNGTPSNNQCTNEIGESTQIGTSEFNSIYNKNAYVGYMYGTAGSSTYAAEHANTNSSTIKQTIDTWYTNNLASYASYISDTLFCNDRSVAESAGMWESDDTALGYGRNYTLYGPYSRTHSSYEATTKNPSLKCTNKNDRFTVSDTTTGNGALTNPIALITIDEAYFAGGYSGSNNTSYYLYTGQYYWSLSPGYYDIYDVYVFFVGNNGYLINRSVSNSYGVRPTINLKADIEISGGNGTSTTPYTIETTPVAPTLISFTIDGTTYQAEEGMTWFKWVNSPYNTNSYSVQGLSVFSVYNYSVGVTKDVRVLTTDTIVDNKNYITYYDSGGSGN